MLLSKEKSRCETQQKIIVSKENKRVHRALNVEQKYMVRQYRLDGDIFQHVKCCDFLVLNDSLKNAYFIELKGTQVSDAVQQLEAAVLLVKDEIQGYKRWFRIVAKNARTHQLDTPDMKKFKVQYGGDLKIRSGLIEEKL